MPYKCNNKTEMQNMCSKLLQKKLKQKISLLTCTKNSEYLANLLHLILVQKIHCFKQPHFHTQLAHYSPMVSMSMDRHPSENDKSKTVI